uniref:Uncharacterized protein n=1 Tax=Tanacetum cinerariifolium TaxID=118510 RepID=A0A699K3N3_TANCI|nr:hypothetical protein [Tanacetum cinerariifolium]
MCDLFDENNLFIFDDESVRISHVSKIPFRKKPRDSINVRSKSNSNKSLPRTVHKWLSKMQLLAELIVQICFWIIDSGCSKHMTGNRALLTNFVEKFFGTVRFGNNDFAVIAGYGDAGLEVAFRKSTCFVRNKDGVDLLTGDRSSNLYTISLNEVASNSSTFLLKKASSSQSWLWHQRLSHLNFTTINNLVKNNLVQGLPKMKFEKDHLCSACEQGKIHWKHHKRNRTLVEAARTMLTFVNLPLFLWAEAIATACFTQNHSIIHKGFDKTPYELMNKRKLNIKFFRVFGCRCYLLNDYEDVGKLKAEWDIGVFVGYSKESAAFRIYNKRTRKIHESVNLNFDEISEMASKQFSLEPVSTSHNVFNERLEDAYFDASTLFHDPSNVHTFYQPYPHEKKWTKDHPLYKIIGDPKSSVRTRGQLANSCLFSCLLSLVEPANVAEALKDADWVNAMQEKLDQFARLKVWRLVPQPEGKTVIKTKWIFKNKKDEISLVIRNKARLVEVGYS